MNDFHCYTAVPEGMKPGYVRPGFPDDTVGRQEWTQFLEDLNQSQQPAEGRDPLAGLRTARTRQPAPTRQRPRVFVSHRRADAQPALKVAYLACVAGFDYWLDVLDPALAALNVNGPGTLYQKALATAGIIEMALLNCTHVIALITDNTPGTMWVPYEYGRVKDSNAISIQASAWLDPNRTPTQNPDPEYLHLGAQHHSEADVQTWLANEVNKWRPPIVANCQWTKKHQRPVPTYSLG